MAQDALKDITEFFENDIGESIIGRNDSLASFRELGPPDLCHIIKSNNKVSTRDIGSYHFVLGTDTSSSATIAAYLNSLSYSLTEEQSGWFSNNKNQPSWKIRSGTYCCFNAFSRVDMRVEVQIPGGVVSYLVDLKGDRHPITNNSLWQETYISGVLRAIMDDNDEPDGNDGNQLRGLRKLDAIKTLESERRFLEAAYSEFWKSWQLGTEPEVQVATYVSNHLSNGLLKYFGDSYRYDIASEFFKPLASKDPEVSVLLAKSYFGYDEEIKAIEVLNDALKKKPQSYSLLLVQIEFLRKKNHFDMALKLAKLAVTYAPSEFITWCTLAEVFFDLDDIEMALLTLNSCPMFTYCERDSNCQRMPMPSRLNIAMNYETKTSPEELKDIKDHISPSDSNGDFREHIHPEALRLPATSLRGTFLKAYELLVKIVRKIGWNKLLYYRSSVFVMEEEYRVQRASIEKKQQEANSKRESTISFSRTIDNKIEEGQAQSSSPTKQEVVNENKENEDEGKNKEKVEDDVDELDNKLEEINLSSDVSTTSNQEEHKEEHKEETKPKEENKEENETKTNDLVIDNDGSNIAVDEDDKTLNKFSQYSFKDKRLCERWLDNLFMVLYEDLKFYTRFRDEIISIKSKEPKHLAYRKSYMEWEVFGDLALRLQHMDEAKEAYLYSFEQKYSSKALLRLLEIYSNECSNQGIQGSLEIINRLVIFYEFTFTDNIYPNPIGRSIFRLIHFHGLIKIKNAVLGLTKNEINLSLLSVLIQLLVFSQCFKQFRCIYFKDPEH